MEERIDMQATELESFPPDENPFWHDAVSVGIRLGDFLCGTRGTEDYYVMASGFSKYDFYIVHKPTGKRIGIHA